MRGDFPSPGQWSSVYVVRQPSGTVHLLGGGRKTHSSLLITVFIGTISIHEELPGGRVNMDITKKSVHMILPEPNATTASLRPCSLVSSSVFTGRGLLIRRGQLTTPAPGLVMIRIGNNTTKDRCSHDVARNSFVAGGSNTQEKRPGSLNKFLPRGKFCRSRRAKLREVRMISISAETQMQ